MPVLFPEQVHYIAEYKSINEGGGGSGGGKCLSVSVFGFYFRGAQLCGEIALLEICPVSKTVSTGCLTSNCRACSVALALSHKGV